MLVDYDCSPQSKSDRLGKDIGVYPGHELEARYYFQALPRKKWPTKMNLRIESRQKRASAIRWNR